MSWKAYKLLLLLLILLLIVESGGLSHANSDWHM